MDNIETRLKALEYELSQIVESDYLNELNKYPNQNLRKDIIINIIPSRDISFKTRTLLSDILDRLELTRQDRQDLEKYIIYGGGENIEYIKSTIGDLLIKVPELNYLIDNIQTVIPLLNKLDELFKDTDENLDSFKELYNTLKSLKTSINNLNTTHNNDIKKINNTINGINHIINNNVLLKKDSPFEKGSAENSAVLKDGNNQAISEGSVALGKNNIVGLKGFYYKNVKRQANPKLYIIYVTKTQTIPQLNATDFTVERDIDLTKYYKVGDILTIINDTKYENCCKLRSFLSVNGLGTIQIELITDRDPFKDGIADMTEEDIDIEDFSIYCVNKPLNGISVLSHSSFVGGHDNKALSTGSFTCGKNNNAFGKFSFAVGRDNEAAYSAYAEGRNNKALRDNAHVEGRNTIASAIEAHAEGRNTTANGAQSHAEGLYTIADGQASHAEGDHTIVTNRAEHAQGKFNASNTDTIHSVGIGTSDNARKNAHEIMDDGRHFIYGIGGYDGTNAVTANNQGVIAKSVQEVINELVNKLNEITTND